MYLYEEEDVARANRTWVMISERGNMTKFHVPEVVNGEEYDNTLHNALWISMTAFEDFNHMSYERILNADDVTPTAILDILPTREMSKNLIDVG